MRKTYIIRHGRSGHNSGRTENLDSALIPDGVVQSRATGNFLACDIGDDLDDFVLYTSPLLRCLMTTESILQSADRFENLRVVVQPLIHESLGPDSDFVTIPIREAQFPGFDWTLMYESLTIGPDDGKKLIARCRSVIEMCNDKSIFVSHGSTCIALGICETQAEPHMRHWDYSINNASVTKIVDRQVDWWGRVIHPFGGFKHADFHKEYCNKFVDEGS